MANKGLKQKAAAGMVWTALQRYSTMLIQFISGIVLARLLTPYDYGCIGMLSIFMTLAEVFIDGGFGSALIQKKNPTQADYSTIFYWNLIMAVLMYAVLFFSAPFIAAFYEIPLLSSVLRVQALVLFIYAFNIIQKNQLRKKLNFKAISIVTVSTSFIALCITIFMAYKGCGVWALVAQNLIVAAIPATVFWFYVKWRPAMVFSKQSFKELFSFGFYMFLNSIVNRICQSIQTLLMGKIYSASTLGYYSKAMNTEKLASHSISSVMTSVTYPLYVQIQDDMEAMKKMVKHITQTAAYLTFPLMFILMLVAKPVFILLYSDRWLDSVPYFQILCLVGLSSCLQAANSQTIAAIGKSKILLLRTVLNRTVGLVFMIGGLLFFGMKGFLVGIVIYNYWCYGVNITLVSKYIGYKWSRQLLDLLPIGLASVVAFVVSYLVGRVSGLGLYANAVVETVVFLTIYMGWSLVFRPESYIYTLSIIPDRYKFWEKQRNE